MATAILWDHDGVLVDTERLYFQATRDVLASVGVDLTVDVYRQLFLTESRGAWHLAAERGIAAAEIEKLRVLRNDRYRDMLTNGDVVIPGALELLERLKSRYRMAVVTSSHREHFDAIHNRTRLRDLVEFVVTPDDYTHYKPHPEPYLLALAKLGLPAAECIAIEDSERGLQSARAAGIRCGIIRTELTEGCAFEGAERCFASLAELGEFLLPPTA
jgi:HAD superfamily hydrolase (TIGR01509 family)